MDVVLVIHRDKVVENNGAYRMACRYSSNRHSRLQYPAEWVLNDGGKACEATLLYNGYKWDTVGTPTKIMALGEALQLFPLEALPELTDGQVFEMEYSHLSGIKVEIKLA